MDTESDRREFLTDTFASWALEGLHPTGRDLELGRAYIAGTVSLDEVIADAVNRCSVVVPGAEAGVGTGS